jgi:nicotinate-nucleotide adenylyltransferase
LVLLATEDNPGFEVSKVEFDMPKPSYTIDTLTYLSEKYPEHEFSLICGTDVLASFHKWKNYEEIINQFKVLVYNRPGQYKHPYEKHPAFTFIDAPSFDISSRFIRAGIRAGKDMRYFLPDKVYQYIKEMHFYEK